MRTNVQIEAELNEQEIQISLIVRHWSTLFPSGKLPTPMPSLFGSLSVENGSIGVGLSVT